MESKGKLITAHQLRYGSYMCIIPEVYNLKKIKQRNDWHEDNVLDHTIDVVSCLEQLTYQWSELSEMIDEHAREDILLLSATLHDIGKLTTGIDKGDKISFPNHEEVGAEIASSMLYPFSLSKKEENRVLNLIRYHGEIHESIKYDDWKERFSELGKKVPILEMTLLGLADTRASKLGKTRPEDYKLRIMRFEGALENYKLDN